MSCLLFTILVCFAVSASAQNTHVPLYRYWHGGVSDHFYTTSAAEIGTTSYGAVGRHGYVYEGIQVRSCVFFCVTTHRVISRPVQALV
jgi:hypothetical protein